MGSSFSFPLGWYQRGPKEGSGLVPVLMRPPLPTVSVEVIGAVLGTPASARQKGISRALVGSWNSHSPPSSKEDRSDRRYKFFSSVLIIYFNPLILNISNLLKFEIRLNLINLIQKETEPGNRAICCHFVSWKINFISRWYVACYPKFPALSLPVFSRKIV